MYTNDRGAKKWTTMMLPEHKEILKGMWEKQQQKERPQFDIQQLEQFSARLSAAYAYKRAVHMTYYASDPSDEQHVCERIGFINKVYTLEKSIEVEGVLIKIRDIIHIEFVKGTMQTD